MRSIPSVVQNEKLMDNFESYVNSLRAEDDTTTRPHEIVRGDASFHVLNQTIASIRFCMFILVTAKKLVCDLPSYC